MKILVIAEFDGSLMVCPFDQPPGMYPVGRGKAIEEAMGNFLILYQKELGLEIVVDKSAKPFEDERRRRELSKR